MTDSWAKALLADWDRILRMWKAAGDLVLEAQAEKAAAATGPLAVLEGYAQGKTTIQVVTTEHLAPKAFDALRAVFKLHAPAPGNAWCLHCAGSERWPCPTIRKITTALEAK